MARVSMEGVVPRQVNTWWDELDADASEEGIAFAKGFYDDPGGGFDPDPRCLAVQKLGVYYDKHIRRLKAKS